MKIPLSWLQEYLDLTPFSPTQIAEALTLGGIEVDKVEAITPSFTGIITAQVLTVTPHPQADKLRIAEVWDGKEKHQVVCGAPNCRPDLKTAFAPIGATLQDSPGKTWKIKKSKLRDVDSYGMLCSQKELELGENSEGILELPPDTPLGQDLAALYSDTLFEISLTPNLGHCLSVLGIARELSALLHLPLKTRSLSESTQEKLLSIQVDDPKLCSHYGCLLIHNVQVAPSPLWLKHRLEISGFKSSNTLVDTINYLLLEEGYPMHVYDWDHLPHKKIRIGLGQGKMLSALDGKEYPTSQDTLLVYDDKEPLALAGVMGGMASAVSETTRSILIEAAHFAPSAVRRTSKALGLRTESSQRFEKGVDPAHILHALIRAKELITTLSPQAQVQGIDLYTASPLEKKELSLRVSRTNALLGTKLSLNEIVSYLKRLQILLVKEEEDTLYFTIPSYRNDLSSEVDLIEEVGRIYGYNNIPLPLPKHHSSHLEHAPLFLLEKKIRTKLLELGLQECLTCDLISPSQAALLTSRGLSEKALLSVLHPRSIDQSVLRPSLLPGLLSSIRYNFDRYNKDLALFEIGRVHLQKEDGKESSIEEPTLVALALSGKERPHHPDPLPKEVDFFDLKGLLENLLFSLGIDNVAFEKSSSPLFHPGRQALLKKGALVLGILGEIHPAVLASPERVFFSELNLHDLFPLMPPRTQIKELPLYPGSERDWTITLKKNTPFATLMEAIQSVPSPLLEKAFLLDLYPQDATKNVTVRFCYRDPHKTLAAEAVEKEHTLLTQKVAQKLQDSLI